jgi:DNA-binding XRE family transcriptional regulator
MKPAAVSETAAHPRHWEKRVLAAYLRMMGGTQQAAAAAVGRSERTIRDWEADRPSWIVARDEARQRWREELTDASRLALLNTIKQGNGYLALQVLERTDDDLSPRKDHVDISGTIKVVRLPQKAASADAWEQSRTHEPVHGRTNLGAPAEAD